MRNQLLIITTILVVGTVSASAFAFYASPNKTVALLGVPAPTVASKPSVAGATTQALIPGFIPILPDGEILSYSKTTQGYQTTVLKNTTVFQTARDFGNLLELNGWENINTLVEAQTYIVTAQKQTTSLVAKIFSDGSGKTLVSSNLSL